MQTTSTIEMEIFRKMLRVERARRARKEIIVVLYFVAEFVCAGS